MMRTFEKIATTLLLSASAARVSAHIADHRYNKGDHVELWVNKVRLKLEESSGNSLEVWIYYGSKYLFFFF